MKTRITNITTEEISVVKQDIMPGNSIIYSGPITGEIKALERAMLISLDVVPEFEEKKHERRFRKNSGQ